MKVLFLEHLAINTERKLVDLLNSAVRLAGEAQSNDKISLSTYWDFVNQVNRLCDYCSNEWEDLPRISEGGYREYYMN